MSDYGEGPAFDLGDIKASVEDAVSELRDIGAILNSNERGGPFGYVWLIFIFILLSEWGGSKPDRFTDRCWFSATHDTAWANVTVEKKPTDCDFLHAPVGRKGCAYKKVNYVFGDDQRRAVIAGATTEEEKSEASKQPNLVHVYWEKKDEP